MVRSVHVPLSNCKSGCHKKKASDHVLLVRNSSEMTAHAVDSFLGEDVVLGLVKPDLDVSPEHVIS